MIEGEEYRALDLLFPLFFSYAETWNIFSENVPLTNIEAQYAYIINHIMWENYSNEWSEKHRGNMRKALWNSKKHNERFSIQCVIVDWIRWSFVF